MSWRQNRIRQRLGDICWVCVVVVLVVLAVAAGAFFLPRG